MHISSPKNNFFYSAFLTFLVSSSLSPYAFAGGALSLSSSIAPSTSQSSETYEREQDYRDGRIPISTYASRNYVETSSLLPSEKNNVNVSLSPSKRPVSDSKTSPQMSQLSDPQNIFEIPELFSSILSFLTRNELMKVRRASWDWKNGVEDILGRAPYKIIWDSLPAEHRNICIKYFTNDESNIRHPILFSLKTVILHDLPSDAQVLPLIQKLQRTKIERAILVNNNFGDLAAFLLFESFRNTSLKMVNMSKNRISPLGAKLIAQKMQDTTIEELDLSHNKLGDEGVISFFSNLPTNSKLKRVELRNCDIGTKGTNIDFTKNIGILDVSNNKLGWRGVKRILDKLKNTNIHTFYAGCTFYSGGTSYTDTHGGNIDMNDYFDYLPTHLGKSIHTLGLHNNAIDDKQVLEFAKNLERTNVRTVDLSGNRISVEGASQLAKEYPHIKWIGLPVDITN